MPAPEGEPIITLHYIDRPPYAISDGNNKPSGVVAAPTELAFKKAKIPFVWAKTPVNRQFAIIKENRGLDCAVGLEQTPSRSEFGKFSTPLYVGKPLIAIINLKVKEKAGVTLAELLKKYTILVKENYTQGTEITEMINASKNKHVTAVESVQMVQMVAQGHGDFMMISKEEVDYYIQHGILDAKSVRVLELPDVQKRFLRRIMCSKAVDDKVITKLDKAIEQMGVF